jgi:hypothetical protein
MKIRNFIMSFLLVTAFALAASANSGGNPTFSGTERFDPFGILGAPIGMLDISAQTVECPGNEPTGNPVQPCPAGGRTHIRNTIIMSRFVSSTPPLSDGWFRIAANANFDADFTGPQWGTYILTLDEGGTIAGVFQGVRVKNGDNWYTLLRGNGLVTGGALDGARIVITDEINGFTSLPIAYIGEVEGKIVSYR